jgi:hypothetical protein
MRWEGDREKAVNLNKDRMYKICNEDRRNNLSFMLDVAWLTRDMKNEKSGRL